MHSPEPSPRPWRVEESIGGWKSCVADANGNSVASCWGGGPTEQQEKAEAIAALIVAAVNGRDRLRDLVKRMADKLEVHRGIFTASNVWSETGCHETCSLIREARAALGEGETPTGKGVG